MAKEDLERLIGRAVMDKDFRERLLADPEKAIQEGKLDLTPEEIAALKTTDPQAAKEALQGMDVAAPTGTWN